MQRFLQTLKFRYTNEMVMFDENHDPPGHYDIMNFQRMGNNVSMEYVNIGIWHNGTLKLKRLPYF